MWPIGGIMMIPGIHSLFSKNFKFNLVLKLLQWKQHPLLVPNFILYKLWQKTEHK